ncbi:MAG: FRG domain-containing protein [Phycisphaerae bacterium]
MAWSTRGEINNVRELAERMDAITYGGVFGPVLFRGQANAEWGLQPSLLRTPVANEDVWKIEQFEQEGVMLYRKSAHEFLDASVLPSWRPETKENELDVLVAWGLMQHYGGPTRVLDWTRSPYIATYFAVRELPDDDALVWFYDSIALRRRWEQLGLTLRPLFWGDFREGGIRHNDLPIIIDFAASEQTPRMVVQQCQLSVCTDVKLDHETAMENLQDGGSPAWFGKFVIPKESKYGIFKHLVAMGINAYALFPGLDGLGRSLQELYQLKADDLDQLRSQQAVSHEVRGGENSE